MSTRRRRSWRLRVDQAALGVLAAQIWPGHAALIGQGYRLTAKSGVWRNGRGACTARLAYRCPRPDVLTSLVVTIRDISVEGEP